MGADRPCSFMGVPEELWAHCVVMEARLRLCRGEEDRLGRLIGRSCGFVARLLFKMSYSSLSSREPQIESPDCIAMTVRFRDSFPIWPHVSP